MRDKQLQRQIGIAGIALGAGRAKGLAIVGQRVGVNGKQYQVSVLAEHRDDCSARLFERHRDRPAAKALLQFRSPYLDRFRGVVEFAALRSAIRGAHRPKMLLVSPVDADVRCKFSLDCCLIEVGHWGWIVSEWIVAGQAGPCFRESLIVESGTQTTSENSFWKQGASRGRSSYGRHRDSGGNRIRCQGAVFVSAGCPLALLPCHQPSLAANPRALFHSRLVATAVENPIPKNS